MQGYRFDLETGVFAGAAALDDSDRDPKDPARFLIPGDVTLQAPPPVKTGEVALFERGAWCVRPRPKPTWDQVRALAAARMAACDALALRCFKRGLPFPPDWIAYDTALQAIIDAPDGDADVALPSAPEISAVLLG